MTRPPPAHELHAVDAVVNHPRVEGLGATLAEQERVGRFALDMARWLVGLPADELGPLARVIITVLGGELRDARTLCRDRPLLAVEAAARAVEALWPLLCWEDPTPPEEPEEAEATDPSAGEGDGEPEADGEAGAAGGGGAGAAGEGDEPAEGEDEPDEDEPDEGEPDEQEPEEDEGGEQGLEQILAAMAEDPALDDPELHALAAKLRHGLDPDADAVEVGTDAADLMQGVADAATEGALQTDRLARQFEHFLPGVGWSSAPGRLETALLHRLGALTALLERLHELRELADRLGRLEEASRRQGPREGGREEVVGVRLGGDFAHALPSELALLADPDTEDLFYQRFLDRRLVTLELDGAGDEGVASGDRRGPVIACIDTSASMAGAPELAAKALVLALCRRVVPQGRLVHLILFGGPGERTEIRIRRGLGGLEGLIDFLNLSFHSGTDFDGPLLRAMDLLEEQELRAADVLVVTDGLCRANRRVVERVEEVRRAFAARVWSLVLGRRDVTGVAPFSDEVHRVDPTVDGDGLRWLDDFGGP